MLGLIYRQVATVCKYSQDDRTFELMWIKLGNNITGTLYHPPKPIYQTEHLLLYLEVTLEEISRDSPAATLILSVDFNQMSDDIVCERTGLTSIVKQPTRGKHILDRIYVSQPSYSIVGVITSVVRSAHSAVVVYADQNHVHTDQDIHEVHISTENAISACSVSLVCC